MITIYSKENCPNCLAVSQICESENLPYKLLKLDVDYSVEQLIDMCPVPIRAVPQVFQDGEYIGDFTKFKQKFVDKA